MQKEPKSLQPKRLLVSKYGKNALAAGAPPRVPLGELPRPIGGFWEGKMGKRKGGEAMSEIKEGEGMRDLKEGEGNRGKGTGGYPTDHLCPPQTLNPGDATDKTWLHH